MVNMYDIGSLLPLSISSIEANPPLRFNLLDLKMENTDAASVEKTTAPKSIPSRRVTFSTKCENMPTKSAVSITPTVAKSIA